MATRLPALLPTLASGNEVASSAIAARIEAGLAFLTFIDQREITIADRAFVALLPLPFLPAASRSASTALSRSASTSIHCAENG